MKYSIRLCFLLIIGFTCSLKVSGQDKDNIINSGNFYYGESVSSSEKEASDNALLQLTKSVAVNVSYTFTKTISGTGSDLKETVTEILNTYANATLKNVHTLKTMSNNKIEVFHYIEKSEVNKIFSERKRLIADIFRKADEYEKELNVGYALKWYYFAIILMNSIPESSIISEGLNLTTEIPQRISSIIDNTKFKLHSDRQISDKERELILDIKSFDKKVKLIEFNFWDGSNQVNVRGIDGEGILRLVGPSVNFNKLDLIVKFDFYENKDEIKEVGELWNLVNKPVFQNNVKISLTKDLEKTSQLKKQEDTNNPPAENSFKLTTLRSENFRLVIADDNQCPVRQKIGKGVLEILELINRNQLSLIKERYAADSYLLDRITSLLKMNNTSIVGSDFEVGLFKTSVGWEIRKISVINRYPALKKQSKEYLVLDFDEDGSLYDMSFGVLTDNYELVKRQSEYGKDWLNRLTLLKFIERYRTCFLCRDINSLDSLFSDQAVIIVGRVLKRAETNEMVNYIKLNNEQPEASYMQYTKKEYMSNLQKLFKNAQDLFLGFSTFDISKKNGDEMVYGISMRQNYYSPGYSDEGYLFLLVDFYYKVPQIYVRSWQPSQWGDEALVRLSNFNINRGE